MRAALAESVKYGHAGPEGTWAGVLYDTSSRPVTVRVMACRSCERPMLAKGSQGNDEVVVHSKAGRCQHCLAPKQRRPRKALRSPWADQPCLGCGRTLAIRDRSPGGLLEKRGKGIVWHHAFGLCLGCHSRLRRLRKRAA
jgi:hypothetical protein